MNSHEKGRSTTPLPLGHFDRDQEQNDFRTLMPRIDHDTIDQQKHGIDMAEDQGLNNYQTSKFNIQI